VATDPAARPLAPGLFRKAFGPGLLWAAAAIGVSHLVQSTRAGADAGFALGGVILLALILKYPFFEYGPRYAAATGRSLVEGYARIGRWAVWTYFLITLATAVIVDGAILLFTGFLLLSVSGLDLPVWVAAGVLYVLCAALLGIGRYRLLDRTVKGILVALAVSTLFAAVLAFPHADPGTLTLVPDVGPGGAVSFAFLIALVGWMPSAVDISVWNSLWTLAKDEAESARASVRDALLDFRIGYAGTGLLAFAFLTLGAAVMHGAGETFSPGGAAFSLQLVELYARTLGAWSRPFVLVAVLTTMLSTSLTVVDGFPRGIARSIEVLTGRRAVGTRSAQATTAVAAAERATRPAARPAGPGGEIGEVGRAYWVSMAAIGIVTPFVLALFAGSLTGMVDFATTVTFLTAPVLGYLNLRAVLSDDVAPHHRPGPALRGLSWSALAVLTAFGILYLVSLLR
jgi:Mn2+/Fe2+ NRAMP family transporter